jgi:hypothetical protein
MPIRGMTGRECPSNCLRCDTMLDMYVFGYVLAIVKVNEIALIDLPERQERSSRQKKINQQELLLR